MNKLIQNIFSLVQKMRVKAVCYNVNNLLQHKWVVKMSYIYKHFPNLVRNSVSSIPTSISKVSAI